MSVIEFRKQEDKKREPDRGSLIKEAIHIVDTEGVDKVHDTLGRRYLQAITTLNALKETRYAIGLVLALSQEEYYSYVTEQENPLQKKARYCIMVNEEIRLCSLYKKFKRRKTK